MNAAIIDPDLLASINTDDPGVSVIDCGMSLRSRRQQPTCRASKFGRRRLMRWRRLS